MPTPPCGCAIFLRARARQSMADMLLVRDKRFDPQRGG